MLHDKDFIIDYKVFEFYFIKYQDNILKTGYNLKFHIDNQYIKIWKLLLFFIFRIKHQ